MQDCRIILLKYSLIIIIIIIEKLHRNGLIWLPYPQLIVAQNQSLQIIQSPYVIWKQKEKQNLQSNTHRKCPFNPCHSNVSFLYPLKTSKNQRSFEVLRGYRNGTLGQNEAKRFSLSKTKVKWIFYKSWRKPRQPLISFLKYSILHQCQ